MFLHPLEEQSMRQLDSVTESVDMSLSKLLLLPHCSSWSLRVSQDLATLQQQQWLKKHL